MPAKPFDNDTVRQRGQRPSTILWLQIFEMLEIIPKG
jgi:hypothetical protein